MGASLVAHRAAAPKTIGGAPAKPKHNVSTDLSSQLLVRSNSFDSIEVISIDHDPYVKKVFLRDVRRAKANVAKQQRFAPLHSPSFKIAAAGVLRFDAGAERAELLMPYVEGLTGEAIVVHGTRKIAQGIAEALSTLLFCELARSEDRDVPVAVFADKLQAALAQCADDELNALGAEFARYLQAQGPVLRVPVGPCHGDLTLNNIIFNAADGITLIDFLDTFLESPLQDVAKILQDYRFGWSLRQANPAIKLKGTIFFGSHVPMAVHKIRAMYPVATFVLTALVLFRIVPYLKDTATRDWVVDSLQAHFSTGM